MTTPENPTEESIDYHTIDERTADGLLEKQEPLENFQGLSEKIKGLGNVTRLRILAFLKQRDLCVHDLSTLLDMSQSAVSHQLKELRNLNLLTRRKEGRVAYYSLNESEFNDLIGDLREVLPD